MIGLAVSLMKDLRRDPLMVRREYAAEAVEAAVVTGVTQHGDDFVIAVEEASDQAPAPAPNQDAATRGDQEHAGR